ncbi:MAG: hypothetical protein WBO57_06760, partial [Gammaproteobacteria bacterium]
GFDYTFAEIGYRNIDGDSVKGDGVRASFSFGVTKYFHVVGDYSRLWIDDLDGASKVDVDLDEFKIGGGGHYPITDKIDVVGQVTYVDDEYNGDAVPDILGSKTNIKDSEEGYEATLFGRVQATKTLELTPHVVHRDVGSESETGFGLGLVYKLQKKIVIRIRGTHFSDESTTNLFAGLRLYM